MINFHSEEFRNYMKEKQYKLSNEEQQFATYYGDKLFYNEIIELKILAVRQILIKYNIEVITDLPFGKGLGEVRYLWEKMMKETIEQRIKINN